MVNKGQQHDELIGRWSYEDIHVYAYRTLLSRANVPEGLKQPIRSRTRLKRAGNSQIGGSRNGREFDPERFTESAVVQYQTRALLWARVLPCMQGTPESKSDGSRRPP